MTDTTAPARAGRRGRGARRDARTAYTQRYLPEMERGIPYMDALLPEQVDIVHDRTMRLLESTGIEFRDDESIEMWRQAGSGGGVSIDGYRLRIDREFLMELVASAPSEYTMVGRDPARSVTLGGRKSIFTPAYGAPFVRDLDGNRRNATLDDFHNFAKIAQMTPAMQMAGGVLCEPLDIAVPHRHLHMTYSLMKHSTKPFMGAVTSRERAEDSLTMAQMLFGEEFVDQNTVMTCLANGNSPLVWDETMLGAMRAFAARRQPILCSPFVLGGANTPASVAASVAQLNAEALSALAYTQVIRKGTPAIYGHFLSTVSMKSGAPMAGTPEISLMNFMIGQMARHYNIPWRTSNTLGGAKTFDAQAGYESATTLSSVIHAGANYIWHSAGWNEAGMHCSVAKFIVDAEQCAMAYRLAEGPKWQDFEAALATVPDIGPGGHYLGHPHTLENFQTAFFMPELFDNNSIEQWQAEGSVEITERALSYAKKLLSEYQEPKLDEAKDEELLDYITQREREIPASDELNQSH